MNQNSINPDFGEIKTCEKLIIKEKCTPHITVITGGIATGKSQVTNYLRSLGYQVLDCDKIVHDGYKINRSLYETLLESFSDNILDENKNIDRKVVAEIIFSDDKKRALVNKIVHKYVVDELMKSVKDCKDNIIFLDIPLMLEEKDALIEMGLKYDDIWLVYVNPQIQKKRLSKRALEEGKNVEQVLKVIDKQMSIDDKVKIVDKIINNEGSLSDLKNNVDLLLD